MGVYHLPNELWLIVGENLERLRDIGRLSLTCSKMKSIFTPLLYARDSRIGRVALLWAAREGQLGTARLAICGQEAGIINVKCRIGQTPLAHAARHGCEAVVKLLLETGKVEVDSNDDFGRTPLAYAAMNGHEAVVKALLETGKVEVDPKDSHGRTPLVFAAMNGHEAVVKALLETGKVELDPKDSDGLTPLAYAAMYGRGAW